ncbi:hypothetical protein ABIA31_007982 [Catenulispora sp. MAP5-51]|uniref:hypothetical protein n=1 Tax=Catenulispora sp. MAP5-51 TaxID=3156298 RepID=UPI003518B83D
MGAKTSLLAYTTGSIAEFLRLNRTGTMPCPFVDSQVRGAPGPGCQSRDRGANPGRFTFRCQPLSRVSAVGITAEDIGTREVSADPAHQDKFAKVAKDGGVGS